RRNRHGRAPRARCLAVTADETAAWWRAQFYRASAVNGLCLDALTDALRAAQSRGAARAEAIDSVNGTLDRLLVQMNELEQDVEGALTAACRREQGRIIDLTAALRLRAAGK